MPVDRLRHPLQVEAASSLSDFEYRVWDAYQLAADDYGVMRLSAVTIQAANEVLAKRPQAAIQKALEAIIAAGLVKAFEWKGRRYCYQPDWQNRQRVKHPRETMQPLPPEEDIRHCTPATQKLFAQRPRQTGEPQGENSGSSSAEDRKQKSGSGSLACARTRETANGRRLTANGSEGGVGETAAPMDVWFSEFFERYPAQSRVRNHLAETAFYDVLCADARVSARAAFDALCARLDGQKRSHQWRVKGMIPRLDRYLREGLHLQELPEHPPDTLLSEKTTRTMSSAKQFASGGSRGTS